MRTLDRPWPVGRRNWIYVADRVRAWVGFRSTTPSASKSARRSAGRYGARACCDRRAKPSPTPTAPSGVRQRIESIFWTLRGGAPLTLAFARELRSADEAMAERPTPWTRGAHRWRQRQITRPRVAAIGRRPLPTLRNPL